MTTALQFSVYDMCHCYNNLNSTHTLNMIVYFCPFGLQFELLQQTQMRWPSWFQDLESYQPMGGGLSLVQLTASFDAHSHVPNWPNHYIKPHAVQCVGHSWHWWLWLLRVRERSQLRWARHIQLEAGLQPRQPLLVLGLYYPIIQPIIYHITGDDYCAMQLPFARGGCVYTSYHGFHESPYPEIRRHSLLPDNLQCVKGIKLPCDGWLLQTRHAAMWFMPTANMHNLIRTDM